MADVLSVIADIIKQDKVQKREHAKVMREVQKKLKEKELPEEEGDKDEYMKFFSDTLKKFGAKSPSELSPEDKKKFFDAIDKGWKGDNEKPEPEDEETSLGDRVKARMEAENEEDEDEPEKPFDVDSDSETEEDEDDDPVGDSDEDEADEPSEEQIDKIADLVLQKIRDKADEEEDEEEEPETTEAESGKKEKIDMNPKVESIHKNPHSRTVWEEAIRKVYEEKVPEPIPVIIKSVGKQLRDYALKSGGIDRDDFLSVSKTMLQGKMPNARSINNMDTDPREFVFDLMAKTFGWKYTEQYSGVRFQRRHDYVESFQGGYKLEEHCGECGAMDHVDEKKMFSGKGEFEVKYASSKKGPIKVSKFNTLDDAKKFLAQVKGEGMNGIISKGGKPVKEEVEEAFKVGDKVKISKTASKGTKSGHKDVLGKSGKIIKDYGDGDMKVNFGGNDDRSVSAKDLVKEESELEEKASDYEDQIKAYLAKGGKIQKGDKPNKRKIDMVTKGFMKKFGAMKKKEADLDAKDKEELEKMMGEAVIQETWLDDDAKKVQSKWKKMDKKAKKKWMDGVMAKAKKDKMPKDEVMDVLDDYGLVEEVSNLQRLEDWGISLKKEGYMVLPAIDRNKYTPMRGMEGPFPTFSGKVLYYDPKAGMYYDRDSDIYLSYDAYLEYDKISPSQQRQMDLGPLGDPKSKEYKAMERIKKKAAKMAKKDQLKNESIGMRFVRKHYRKDKDSI